MTSELNETNPSHQRLQIGDLELNTGTRTLHRGGEEINLPNLSFELLLCLARNAPNVVSTQALMDAVWSDVVVGEETVKQRIKLLRQSLGDDPRNPRYIVAIRGRGYRLISEVTSHSASPANHAPPQRGIRQWIIAIALLAAIVAAVLVYSARQTPAPGMFQPGSTENAEAWENYVKGRAAYRRWSHQDNELALAFFNRASAQDPDFALALAGAANANALRATEFGLGEEWIDEAITLARRALEVEPDLPEALKALGICYFYKGHYQTALDYNRSALRLNPEYDEVIFNMAEILHIQGHWGDAVSYQKRDSQRPKGQERLSIYLRDLGLDDQAATVMEQARQDLPTSYFSDANLSLHALLNKDFDQARDAAKRMQRALPNAAGGWLREGEIGLLSGDLHAASTNFGKAWQLAGGSEDYARLRHAQMELLLGSRQQALELMQQTKDSASQHIAKGHEAWFHRWHLAVIYALEGNTSEALEWFEQAVDAGRRRYEWDEIEPAFSILRNERRFQTALQRQKQLRQEMKRESMGTL